jgi:putative nucleotidyltransferase with HDIG domain
MTLIESATKIVKTLQNNGYQATFAGGYVRDRLMNIEPNDIDIATDAKQRQIQEIFDDSIVIGKAFGVVQVSLDGFKFEVATFRIDSQSSDGRRPDLVTFTTSMKEDAQRRDLTINSLYFDPVKTEIIDHTNGMADIKLKTIRFVGSPEDRIQEDYLRMLRAVRFALKTNFTFDEGTLKALQTNAYLIQDLDPNRVREEFVKMLKLRKFQRMLELLDETNLLLYLFPELRDLQECEQPKKFHPEGDVWAHTILALESLKPTASIELILGTMFHDVGKPKTIEFADRIRFNSHDVTGAKMTFDILLRLKFSNKTIEHVCALVKDHMKFMSVPDMKKSTLRRFMSKDHFEDHLELHRADCLSSNGILTNYNYVLGELNKLEQVKQPVLPERLVTGKDLIEMGMSPSPEFRVILEAVMDEQLEGLITTREEAICFIVDNFIGKE